MLAASVLTDQPITLHNVPAIEDVSVMLEILCGMGVSVHRTGSAVQLCARGLRDPHPSESLCRRVRASILLAGPLAARHGRAVLPAPGGDLIGRRRLDTHVTGLRELGIDVEETGHFVFRRKQLKGAYLLLDEASVTATENIIMAASLAEGETTIFHAACEPHVIDLCNLLNAMGASIEGHGTNRIIIRGQCELTGAEHTISPDYIEIASFSAAAAVTGGDLSIEDLEPSDTYRVLARGFQKLGLTWLIENRVFTLSSPQTLRIQQDLGSCIPKIEDGIWPSFPSDVMSIAIVVATQAQGTILFFEKLFESRMFFVDRLIEMGARIVQCDPHRVVVQGPSSLQASHMTSPDIRAGMSMLVAALCAKGTSVIEHAQMIDRGYERIDERLRCLGAKIEREPS